MKALTLILKENKSRTAVATEQLQAQKTKTGFQVSQVL